MQCRQQDVFLCSGYCNPAESGLYYLQSRYYDPEIGRFLNADALVSTGQGLLGNNMFAYCRNNPVNKQDENGFADEDAEAEEEAKAGLAALLDKYTKISEFGFSISIDQDTSEWDKYIQQMGVNQAYSFMSDYLCQKYYETYGEEYLFSNNCVAYEIEYHVDAFMTMRGYDGYLRNVTTLLFTKEYLIDHCKTIDISTRDVTNLKQSIMFNYMLGIRSCYVCTEKDPYAYKMIYGGEVHYERA